jgi:hypothetical protein
MADARLIVAVLALCPLLTGCGTSTCGLGLREHLFLPPSVLIGGVLQQQDAALPCCGGTFVRDINLPSELEVDLTNPNPAGVDGFLTTTACDKLFESPYTGATAAPLCQVYLGAVRPRAVSERRKIPSGRYRIYAQGYATNAAQLMISLDLGVWSNACKWNPIGP